MGLELYLGLYLICWKSSAFRSELSEQSFEMIEKLSARADKQDYSAYSQTAICTDYVGTQTVLFSLRWTENY